MEYATCNTQPTTFKTPNISRDWPGLISKTGFFDPAAAKVTYKEDVPGVFKRSKSNKRKDHKEKTQRSQRTEINGNDFAYFAPS